MAVRGKFRCQFETHKRWGSGGDCEQRSYEFSAVYDDGNEENQKFAKATPNGQLTVMVDNPAVVFKPGKFYYLDLTEVEE